jgi:hypothetical protein
VNIEVIAQDWTRFYYLQPKINDLLCSGKNVLLINVTVIGVPRVPTQGRQLAYVIVCGAGIGDGHGREQRS